LFCGWGYQPNGNGVGNYLALVVKVANPGSEAIYFERLEAVDAKGTVFFPLLFGVAPNTLIAPKTSSVGYIPCGHVRSNGVRELRVYDVIENVYVLKGKKLRAAVEPLIDDMNRLESLELGVHPTSPYPD
jgi:hypothetical protein